MIAAGVPTEISDNERGALWGKLILNCAYNALMQDFGPNLDSLREKLGGVRGLWS